MNPCSIIALFVVIGGILYFISPILSPFLVGALLAWLFNPAVARLARWHVPRLVSILLVLLMLVVIILVVVLLVVPLIGTQLIKLLHFIPTIITFAQQNLVPRINHLLGADGAQWLDANSLKSMLVQNWMKAGGVVGWAWQTVLRSGMEVLRLAGFVILIPVVALYLLYDWQGVLTGVHSYLPRRFAPTIVALVKECDQVLAAFFRGQLLVMLTLGTIYAIGLSALGMQVGVLIGLVTGLLAIVPYLGVSVGLLSAIIVAWVQAGNWHAIIPVMILFAVVQTCDAMFITPRLVGHRIGLHPVVVIFAIMTGGMLFGFTGVLLALPVAAVIRVLLRFFCRAGDAHV